MIARFVELLFVVSRGSAALVSAMDKGLISIAAAAELALLPDHISDACLANARLRQVAIRLLREGRRRDAEPSASALALADNSDSLAREARP